MGIKDRDVSQAIETLQEEFERKEDQLDELEQDYKDLNDITESLRDEVESLKEQVKDLEEALAEAYLTSSEDDSGSSREVDIVQSGCRADVPDTTGH